MSKSILISISDRTGISDFAKKISGFGFQIIATSGTQKFLKSEGIECKTVSEVTGFPEILGGRVKTLHPKILGAILANRGIYSHLEELKKLKIPLIDIVVCNLYPFKSSPGVENIDIGGVTLIRAAAKNYKDITCITNPEQYERIIEELKNQDEISEQTRFEFAKEAFKLTSSFDNSITNFFANEK